MAVNSSVDSRPLFGSREEGRSRTETGNAQQQPFFRLRHHQSQSPRGIEGAIRRSVAGKSDFRHRRTIGRHNDQPALAEMGSYDPAILCQRHAIRTDGIFQIRPGLRRAPATGSGLPGARPEPLPVRLRHNQARVPVREQQSVREIETVGHGPHLAVGTKTANVTFRFRHAVTRTREDQIPGGIECEIIRFGKRRTFKRGDEVFHRILRRVVASHGALPGIAKPGSPPAVKGESVREPPGGLAFDVVIFDADQVAAAQFDQPQRTIRSKSRAFRKIQILDQNPYRK